MLKKMEEEIRSLRTELSKLKGVEQELFKVNSKLK
jgi:hypothetical protein